VDCSLVVQYFYYTWRSKPSLGHPRSLISGVCARRLSVDRGASRYRTLSAVAANVAAAAALAAQQNEQLDHKRRRQRHSEDRERLNRHAFEEHTAETDVDEDGFAAMTASFHSEGGHEPRPKRVSWSNERHSRRGGSVDHMSGISRSSIPPRLQLTSTDSLADSTGRGRSLQRDEDGGLQTLPTSTDRSSRTSRRATMVFLGVWAFFSIGALAGVRHGAPTGSSSPIGRVLAVKSLHMSTPIPIVESHMSYDSSLLIQQWSERVIGRIFAWLCTTLYLTSRLPQIWKNVRPLLILPRNQYAHYLFAVC
jgi:solute carrier family 66 (lysosomal lysine-arginine transporter), member 1